MSTYNYIWMTSFYSIKDQADSSSRVQQMIIIKPSPKGEKKNKELTLETRFACVLTYCKTNSKSHDKYGNPGQSKSKKVYLQNPLTLQDKQHIFFSVLGQGFDDFSPKYEN